MDKSKIIKMLKNFKSRIFLFCHSRLRGNDRGNASTRKSSAFRKKLLAISCQLSAFRKLSANSYKLKAILSIFRNLKPSLYNLKPSLRNLPPTTYHLQPNRGFAMLFSVLISSLLVVIGLSIFNITLKELTISTSSRESQIAFYAANSGMECALYWNLKQNAFATTTTAFENNRVTSIIANCNGVRVNDNYSKTGQTTITSASNIQVTDSSGSCFNITISKTPDVSAGEMLTVIESQGKNICDASGRRVERGLRANITTEM